MCLEMVPRNVKFLPDAKFKVGIGIANPFKSEHFIKLALTIWEL